MATRFQPTLAYELGLFLRPLLDAADNPKARHDLFNALGWQLNGIPGLSLAAIDRALAAVAEAYTDVHELAGRDSDEALDTWIRLISAIDTVWTAIDRLRDVGDAAGDPTLVDLRNVGNEIINFLAVRYVSVRHPVLYEMLTLLTLVGRREPPQPVVSGSPPRLARVSRTRPELRFDRLVPLLQDPVGLLRREYVPAEGVRSGTDAQRVTDRLFPRVGGVLAAMGIPVYYGLRPDSEVTPDFGPLGNAIAEGVLAIFLPGYELHGEIRAGGYISFALAPADRGNLGLVVVPVIAADYENRFGDWRLRAGLQQQVVAFAIGPDGFRVLAGADVTRLQAAVTASRGALPGELSDTAPAFRLGSPTGTRLELGGVRLSAFCDLEAEREDYGFELALDRASLVLAGADGDAFLQQALRSSTIRVDAGLAIGWSSRRGLMIGGTTGLDVDVPIHKSLFGALTVDTLHLALRPAADGDHPALGVEIAVTGSLQLGPISASIDRVGIAAELGFPEGGGNLGPLAVDRFPAFKPPQAIGLGIDAGAIVGGGFLLFAPERGEYAGVLQLEVQETISLTAIGLLTTRMLDGSRGFSLVIIITADGFQPIPLGYGFTLNGVGGLIAVNRTVALPVLRAGIKQGTLNRILFPPDPVRNAPQIISDLRAVFPPAAGRYVFGPMAIIGWGTPTLLTLELGIILEFPAPVRLILLGRLRALLPVPDEDLALVRLQMDALGIVEIDSGDISLDATLFDSRLLQYTLTGDMALRANVGTSPAFVLAIGGFHPRFEAPPGFPALDRIAIALATGNNPRIRLDAYLALTANTAQFGARVELFARQSGFSIEGSLGFDALFQFDPFRFVADVGGRVTVRRGRRKLTTVRIDMELTGPTPLHAHGKAKFDVLGVKHSVRFSGTFGGENRPSIPAASVDVAALLVEAVRDPRNWSGQLPPGAHAPVALRERPVPGAIRVSPNAVLTLRQRIVPLGLAISRFGQAKPAGARRFTIIRTQIDGRDAAFDAVRDHFAPAQFLEMTDDEKLASPSFELLQTGIAVGRAAMALGAHAEAPIAYKTAVIDPRQERVEVLTPQPLASGDAGSQSGFGAAARSARERSGRAKYRSAARPIKITEPAYVVSSLDDNTPQPLNGTEPPGRLSYVEAMEQLRVHVEAAAADRGRFQVRAVRVGDAA